MTNKEGFEGDAVILGRCRKSTSEHAALATRSQTRAGRGEVPRKKSVEGAAGATGCLGRAIAERDPGKGSCHRGEYLRGKTLAPSLLFSGDFLWKSRRNPNFE